MTIYVFIRRKYRIVKSYNLHHYEGRKDVIIIFVLNIFNNIFNPFVEYIRRISDFTPNLNGPFLLSRSDNPDIFLPGGYSMMSTDLINDYNNNRMFYILKFDS